MPARAAGRQSVDFRPVTTPPTPIDVAFALLREGRMGDAENLVTRELSAVADKHGEGSAPWASAQSDLGTVLLNASLKNVNTPSHSKDDIRYQ